MPNFPRNRAIKLFIALCCMLYVFSCATTPDLPLLFAPEWKDEKGNTTEKAIINTSMFLTIEAPGIKDNVDVTFKIYKENENPAAPVATLTASVASGKAKAEWNFGSILPESVIDEELFAYYKDKGENIPRERFEEFFPDFDAPVPGKMKKKPWYFFTAEARGCITVRSESIEVSRTMTFTAYDEFDKPLKGALVEVKSPDGTVQTKETDEEGFAAFTDLLPTMHHLRMTHEGYVMLLQRG